MITLLIIGALWLALGVLVAIGWARFNAPWRNDA